MNRGAALRAGIEHDFLAQKFLAVLSSLAQMQRRGLLLEQRMIIHIDRCFRLFFGHACPQASQHSQESVIPVVESVANGSHLALHGHRHEDVRCLSHLYARESCLRHADDSHHRVVHEDRLIQHPGVAAKVLHPITVAQHKNRVRSLNIVIGGC